MHRNRKNTRITRLSWFRYETFITFLTFRFSTRGERDTIFTMLTVPSDPTRRGAPPRPNWTNLGSNLNSLFFSKSSRILAHRFWEWRHSHSSLISYLGVLLWHLWLSHPPRVRVNTCVNVYTDPCTKSKVLSLTKPNDKIYKTKNDNIKKKSRNYITYIYTYIYRVEFSGEEVIVLPLAPLQVSSYLNWDLGGCWTDVYKQ